VLPLQPFLLQRRHFRLRKLSLLEELLYVQQTVFSVEVKSEVLAMGGLKIFSSSESFFKERLGKTESFD
jgi:hypothetical protein